MLETVRFGLHRSWNCPVAHEGPCEQWDEFIPIRWGWIAQDALIMMFGPKVPPDDGEDYSMWGERSIPGLEITVSTEEPDAYI